MNSLEVQQGSLFSSTREPSIVQRNGSDDAVPKRKSLEVTETQEVSSMRRRSQSFGAIASSVPGVSKKARLQALGLVIDSSASKH